MNLLISGCLLGLCCRYDGKEKPLPLEQIRQLQSRFHLIPVCPEQLGGLTTPRPPAERRAGRVMASDGIDVTMQYQKGAEEALKMARLFSCDFALLKERSPSCGFGRIYDGSFSKNLTDGNGTAADLLSQNGIRIFGESQIEMLLSSRNQMEQK
ncbi:DUF523 domain-containing protein [Ructibacterium gallinarum]|uniref:DUF523 domain-containing protein n=1 Tax=Ructibacterium gallinarum TaxID=2779355 RepID=A0A9D5RBP1_9FIRM|nr:DUF523 domain-containing protein [Ructibacterium gallinarum]MBE5040228.1 DUF523 domain-containing protein [Ructibacterium gallinarum]